MNSPIMSPFILYRIVAQSPFELSEILLVSFCFVCLIKSVLFLFCSSHSNPFIFHPTQVRLVCFSGFLLRRKLVIFGSVLSVMKRSLPSEIIRSLILYKVIYRLRRSRYALPERPRIKRSKFNTLRNHLWCVCEHYLYILASSAFY